MKRKLAIIHTTPVTVEPLKTLALELMPDLELFNLVDDSILPELIGNGGRIEAVEERWRRYALIAEKQGADCILNACSSIGGLVARVQPDVGVPIVRIDEAMAEEAVRPGGVIGVAATLETTLKPTADLLRQQAERIGVTPSIRPMLVASAYRKLAAGDRDGHDEDLSAALRELAAVTDRVVLAQASMARVLERLAPEERGRFLTSPRLGMEAVKRKLYGERGE